MKEVIIGNPFIELDEVGSTNDVAKSAFEKGEISEGTAWHAQFQNKGKGQRGKTWMAKSGDNINLSFILYPKMLKPTETFVLNMVISLAVYDLIKEIAGADVCIKWSNDIYFKDKKVCGILIENHFRGKEWEYAIIGIGVNLNQETFDNALPNPISLRQITGKKWNPVLMAKRVCKCITSRYHNIEREAILKTYEQQLFWLNKPGLFQKEEEKFEATIRSVQPDGTLVLERDKKLMEVTFGEIKFLVG